MNKFFTTTKAGYAYFLVHFSIEVACFYFLFSRLVIQDGWWLFALLYDALAFLPQNVLGFIADKFKKIPYGAIGCALMLIALLLPFDYLSLFLIGIGNAFAHVDGAQHTLRGNKGKISPNAIYVGGGAFGVVTGQLLGDLHVKLLVLLPISLMLVSILICVAFTLNHTIDEKSSINEYNLHNSIPTLPFLALIIIAVACRSYTSYAIPTAWNKTVVQTVLLFAFMGIGKILGGVLADNIGYKTTTLISLFLSIPFLIFGDTLMTVSLIGIMLFNMTMPITVGLVVSKFNETPCFAFGITTFSLFVGVTPAFFIRPTTLLSYQITCTLSCLIALSCILATLKSKHRR